jgi:lysophospholipase L1-like esterase
MTDNSPDGEGDDNRDAEASPTRRGWFRLLAVGIPTVIGVALLVAFALARGMLEISLAEGVVQLRDPSKMMYAYNYDASGHVVLYDEKLGWRNPPNLIGRTFGHPLRINARGLRGRNYPYAKPGATDRILVLGDSYAWGFDVGDAEVFSEVLEARLSAGPRNIEVINTGVSGWGTDQEFLFFMDEGLRYAPDIVVLAFYVLNDFNENTVSRQHGHNKPFFRDRELNLAGVPVPQSIEGVAEQKSSAGPIEITMAIIERLERECRAREIDFVLMIFGTMFRAGDAQMLSYTEPFFERLAQVEGLRYFDLDDRFIARGIGSRQLTAGNAGAHWNAYGHQLAAEELQAYLVEESLVPAAH